MTTTSEVRERPILFSAPMVSAILERRKTQTRRVILKVPTAANRVIVAADGSGDVKFVEQVGRAGLVMTGWRPCPFGGAGDRLWVRETHHLTSSNLVIYRADYPQNAEARGMENIPPESDVRWRPSIHMPRWASRTTLEVTEARVERVQEIDTGDVFAEGIPRPACLTDPSVPRFGSDVTLRSNALGAFRELWDSLNARRGFGWDANPWVWVIGFRVITP